MTYSRVDSKESEHHRRENGEKEREISVLSIARHK